MKKIKQIAITDSYIKIDTSQIEVGDTIDFDCYVNRFKKFVVIIPAGTLITANDFKLLQTTEKHYVSSIEQEKYEKFVSVKHDDLAIEEAEAFPIDCNKITKGYFKDKNSLQNKAKVIYLSLTQMMENFFEDKSEINQECIEELLHFYIILLKKDPSIFKRMLNSMQHQNKHEHHSVNVAVLSLALGNFLKYPISQMKLLGKAALLHDIGKKNINDSIFKKKSSLSIGEYEHVKTHPDLGYKAAKEMKIYDETILSIILHHHEYLDGTGYPDGLQKGKISNFTQIVSVCDIFDAMTSERSFRNKKNAFETLKTMKLELHNKLHAKYMDDFIKLFSKTYS